MTTLIINFSETNDAQKIKEIVEESIVVNMTNQSGSEKLERILTDPSIAEISNIKVAILIGEFNKLFIESVSLLEKNNIYVYVPYNYINGYSSIDVFFDVIYRYTKIKMQQSGRINNLLKYMLKYNQNIKKTELKMSIKFYAHGDCFLINNVFDKHTADTYFNYLLIRTKWRPMEHKGGKVPRLVSIQHEDYTFKSTNTCIKKSIKCKPIYRHPTDSQPKSEIWSKNNNPITLKIKNHLSELICLEFNHALVQYYRNAKDYISEHVDKTLDISQNSPIMNVSLGRTRKMKLRNKIKQEDGTRKIEHVELKHGSVFVLGLQSNKYWMHSIRADKRMNSLKRKDELLFNEQRISLTFRMIGTYMDIKTGKLFGQGVPENYDSKINDTQEMIFAFAKENREIEYTWNELYGEGFNSLGYKEV